MAAPSYLQSAHVALATNTSTAGAHPLTWTPDLPPTQAPNSALTVALLLGRYRWTAADEVALASVLLAAMRSVFIARWNALGYLGSAPPKGALARLSAAASQVADNATRAYNRDLQRFLAKLLTGPTPPLTEADAEALIDAWLDARAQWKGDDLGQQQTILARSYADLFAGGSDAHYLVDGPELTPLSCPTCRANYQQVLTQTQAWQLLFPAHPNCEHYLRLLTPDEVHARTLS